MFEGVFVGLSSMDTIVDGVTFLNAEATYHSWAEGRFSFERWGRWHGSSACVIVVAAAVRWLWIVVTEVCRSGAAAVVIAALISVTAVLKVIMRSV